MANIKRLKPVATEMAAQPGEVKEQIDKEFERADARKEEKILVKLK